MPKFAITLLLFTLFSSYGQTEDGITAKLVSQSNITHSLFIGSDSFGYHYFIENNVFFKEKSSEIKSYKNIQLGKISKVDILNPLKMVLFYEDFNSVVLLDNQLNETAVLHFSENSIPISATAVGTASQNQIWIYNSLNQQIGLLNYLNKEYKTVSVPLKNEALYYQTDFNHFFWIDQQYNWYSCDLFGNVKLITKVPDFDQIQFLDDRQFIYKKYNKLYYSAIDKLKKVATTAINFPQKSFEKFYYNDQNLVIFTTSEKINYKIIVP
ncbi:hypothetical protein [Flavobacterium agrisoli]|uniref:WG repeat protein n=1 Tax=Flavobacterium agrisoli TaxID=2793066 RepID=A0A934PPG9_9FLAO|nr:hypothetical protein [Flavobacterium agrisoli]MBK0370640.1 hypothetical protein [Flavobacterium agrisoli]